MSRIMNEALDLIQAVKFEEKVNVRGKLDRMDVREVKDVVQGIEAFYAKFIPFCF